MQFFTDFRDAFLLKIDWSQIRRGLRTSLAGIIWPWSCKEFQRVCLNLLCRQQVIWNSPAIGHWWDVSSKPQIESKKQMTLSTLKKKKKSVWGLIPSPQFMKHPRFYGPKSVISSPLTLTHTHTSIYIPCNHHLSWFSDQPSTAVAGCARQGVAGLVRFRRLLGDLAHLGVAWPMAFPVDSTLNGQDINRHFRTLNWRYLP